MEAMGHQKTIETPTRADHQQAMSMPMHHTDQKDQKKKRRTEREERGGRECVFVSTGTNERRIFGEEGHRVRWVRTGEGRGGLSEGGKGGLLHSQLVKLAQLLRGGGGGQQNL